MHLNSKFENQIIKKLNNSGHRMSQRIVRPHHRTFSLEHLHRQIVVRPNRALTDHPMNRWIVHQNIPCIEMRSHLWSSFGPTSQATYPLRREATPEHLPTHSHTLSVSLVHPSHSLYPLTTLEQEEARGRGRRRIGGHYQQQEDMELG